MFSGRDGGPKIMRSIVITIGQQSMQCQDVVPWYFQYGCMVPYATERSPQSRQLTHRLLGNCCSPPAFTKAPYKLNINIGLALGKVDMPFFLYLRERGDA